jgi:leucyl aminopeptidase
MYRIVARATGPSAGLIPVRAGELSSPVAGFSDWQKQWIKAQAFKAEWGSFLALPDDSGQISKMLLGTENQPADPRAWIQLFSKLARSLPPSCYVLPNSFQGVDQALLGWGLGGYQFNRYLNRKASEQACLQLPEGVDATLILKQLDALILARDLINTPASDMGPSDLAEQVRAIAHRHGAMLQVLAGKDLLENGFPAIHAVGRGSTREPMLLDLRWGSVDHPRLTLVGKGVTFDTGGLNLKNPAGMAQMKKDMAGAAVAAALARLVMEAALPVRLRLLIPCVENSPGGDAYRPGDVIATRKGLSVEIGNTDAEGRIILCDALAEAVAEQPDLLIDFATLTGACRTALGTDLPGFWCPDDELATQLAAAGDAAIDPVWRMPLWAPYRNLLKSGIADINNMASSTHGGAITAALFLYEFVKPFSNWIHIDMFGWNPSDLVETSQMGEASSLRAVFALLQRRYPS